MAGFYQLAETLTQQIDDLNPAEIKEALNGIHFSAKHLYKLLENLLEWARLQLGQAEFKPVFFDLVETLAGTVRLLQTQANRKDIILELTEPNSPISVKGDANMVGTVVRNLISNAIKFTHRTCKITISYNLTDDNFVQIKVADTGTGMDESTLSNLFSIGNSQSHSGTENEQGTGLGLVLCKELVEKHGGIITVDSAPNKGSVFQFSLPLC